MGSPPSAQPETAQKLYSTFSVEPAEVGTAVVINPQITSRIEPTSVRIFLFGITASTTAESERRASDGEATGRTLGSLSVPEYTPGEKCAWNAVA